jgi:hypothetical protein
MNPLIPYPLPFPLFPFFVIIRKVVSDEFSEIYIIDLGGNIRTGDKSGSVFGVKVGTALWEKR